MNASRNSRFCKGSVIHPENLASRIAMVFKAPFCLGLITMRRAGEVRAFSTDKGRALFCFRFLGGHASQARLTDQFAGFVGANVTPNSGCVAISNMLFGSQAFKIFYPVVRFISVTMVDMLCGVKRLQPTLGYDAVHKSLSTKRQISVGSLNWGVWKKFSENFSAARNSKKVVKESVFGSGYLNANHAVPLGG